MGERLVGEWFVMVRRMVIASLSALVAALLVLALVVLYGEDTEEVPTVAEYEVTFDGIWSESTHPYDFPGNPHFSGLIGATHHSGVSFWAQGEVASEGIKNVAERGSKDPFNSEIDDAVAAGTAFGKLSGGGVEVSPGSVSLAFDISKDYPLVTLVSMIAPSPDWFLGVSGIALFENGDWVPQKVVELYLYDAGRRSPRLPVPSSWADLSGVV